MGTNTSTPHLEVVLSATAPSPPGAVAYFGSGEGIIAGRWKLVTGVQLPGPFGNQNGHPRCDNASAFPSTSWGPKNPGVNCDCGAGCLFDLQAVRTEPAPPLIGRTLVWRAFFSPALPRAAR
mmetsp:Transcript_2745/g.6573  ORF Transcript_2745/g.6573 Transcript_2745/m.6573 type:complete len:122 (-) Transcript_2745:1168-1533(-)